MPLNLGYMEVTGGGGAIVVRIYYDSTIDPSLPQPLINGPRGYALDVTNTGPSRQLRFTLPNGTTQSANVGSGDPVTNRSYTAAQLNNLGYVYRTDVNGLTIE